MAGTGGRAKWFEKLFPRCVRIALIEDGDVVSVVMNEPLVKRGAFSDGAMWRMLQSRIAPPTLAKEYALPAMQRRPRADGRNVIYALGGKNGSDWLNSVECFDGTLLAFASWCVCVCVCVCAVCAVCR